MREYLCCETEIESAEILHILHVLGGMNERDLFHFQVHFVRRERG